MIKVKNVRRIKLDKPVPVYDATSPLTHNFALANGVIVHNTAKYARDKDYQEVMRLSGKPINTAKATLAKSLSSEPVQHILTAVGYDFNNSVVSPRVGKIMLLSDADHDGHHITLLILTMLWTFCKELFERGMVYVVDSPLYMARDNKRNTWFADDLEGIKKQTSAKVTITRIKGWGEVNADVLRRIAFDPETRKVFRITSISGANLTMFNNVVGEDTSTRKQLLGVVDKERK